MALKTPKQIAGKIKSLKKEISLLEKAKKAEMKAKRAVKTASRSMHKSKGKKRAARYRRKKR
ncbi:hypothetical protein HYT25_01255 [Candidatus Pacearchaeota archaeon]|nr:hypothetical protein [Candidatus Pacearchaeota archaeon]